jgi:hypothetical protein
VKELQIELARLEGLALNINKGLSAVEYRLDKIEQAIPAIQQAILELAGLGEAVTPTKEKKPSAKRK